MLCIIPTNESKLIFKWMLGSWSSIAEDNLECSYTMLCEISCYNRKQAFLQIKINEDDRDAMRFNWIKDREILKTVILRFTCLMFGLSPSPFVLEGTIKHHLERYEQDQPQAVAKLKKNVCWWRVGEGDNVESAKTFKENIVKIFNETGFELPK